LILLAYITMDLIVIPDVYFSGGNPVNHIISSLIWYTVIVSIIITGIISKIRNKGVKQ
jgi:hypothetical protein